MESTTNVERQTLGATLIYLAIGVVFGVALIKSETASWFRMQEMFRFQSFHIFGIMGSAVLVGMISLWVFRKLNIKDRHGSPIVVPQKELGKGTRYWLGGSLFGVGWALTGACPGPVFALMGSGISVIIVVFVSALIGTWVYGYLRPSLPH